MEEISLQYKISLKDFKDAYEYHWKCKKLGTKENLFLSILGILIASTFLFFNLFNFIVSIMIFIICSTLLIIILLRNFLYKRSYLTSPKFVNEINVIFSDKNIRTETSVGSSELNWDVYKGYKETKDHFLLYITKETFSIIPKRAFSSTDELDTFRDLITRNTKQESIPA